MLNSIPFFRTPLLLLLLFTLGGCSSEYTSNHQSNGDTLVSQLHQALQQGQWERLKQIYSKAYLEQNTIDMVQEQWDGLLKKYGTFQAFRLRSQQKDSRLQGEFYIYRYAVLFDHGTVNETITVFRSGQDETLTISGHRLVEGS